MPGLQGLGLVCAAYLIGSIPFGLLVAQAVGRVDIRRYGSGNIGTANVLRTVGKRAALLTLLGDLCKGLFPALAALINTATNTSQVTQRPTNSLKRSIHRERVNKNCM
ncbi:MAG: glycerol-3-phosphate acyltransferase [candidate division NC10 bacterium]|nr:glycerol-3-phosphate acyltransferase [candidate division NC10 bacterium]